MKVVKVDYDIKQSDYVSVVKMNHITEVQYLAKRTPKGSCAITRLPFIDDVPESKDRFVVNSTGEIKQFHRNTNRSQSLESLRQTMKRLRYMINNNFVGANNEFFITLTYKENMKDSKKLYIDFDIFMKRFKRAFGNGNFRYLVVAEPQERGAWHLHLLVKFKNSANPRFIGNEFISGMWEHGFVSIKKMNRSFGSVDNLGAYFCSYFTNLDVVCEDEQFSDFLISDIDNQTGKNVKKRVLKGRRLHFYPSNFNFYRSSRNCKKPNRDIKKFSDVCKQELGRKTFERSIAIVDTNVEDGDFLENGIFGDLKNIVITKVFNNFKSVD